MKTVTGVKLMSKTLLMTFLIMKDLREKQRRSLSPPGILLKSGSVSKRLDGSLER